MFVSHSMALGRALRCVGALVLAVASLAVAAEPRLMYRGEPGDCLVYERRGAISSLSGAARESELVDQIRVWYLAAEGGELLVLLDRVAIVDGRPAALCGGLAYVDSYGRVRMPEPTQRRAVELDAVLELFLVQRRPLQEELSWQTPADLFGRVRHCERMGRDAQQAGHVRIECSVEYGGRIGAAFGRSGRERYWFDQAGGHVSRLDIVREDRAGDVRLTAVTVLRQRQEYSGDWVARRINEAQRYLAAQRREDSLLDEIAAQPDGVAQALERLERLWAGMLVEFAGAGESPFYALCRARQRALREERAGLRARARYVGRWLGQAAIPWSLTDRSGAPLMSEQVRLGPVVECLWSVGAPQADGTVLALHAMQRELAADGIPVICLNLDQDQQAARQWLAELPEGVVHVLAGPLGAVERPVALPVVRVLDGAGVVRYVRVGWQPSYADVVAEVRRLAE
jgi:hypothetical protein